MCKSDKITLWTLPQIQPSQLLQTINATFYPNIEIVTGNNITNILNECEIGCHILYTAMDYPNSLNPMETADYKLIDSKSVNIYIEFPDCIFVTGGYCYKANTNGLMTAKFERAVVITDKLPPLTEFTIIDLHAATWLNAQFYSSIMYKDDILMMAKVAGYDYALYEFDYTEVYPLLFQQYPAGNGNMIVALTSFADYSFARYVPFANMKIILTSIINKLMSSNLSPTEIKWISQPVQPSFMVQSVALDVQSSFQRGIDWIFSSKLLVDKFISVESTSGSRPTPSPLATIGDGSNGIFEGFESLMNNTGGQGQSIIIRTDCQGEMSGSLAWSGYIHGNAYHSTVSWNLLNFIYNTSIAQQGERNDPKSSAYGLLLWGVNAEVWNVTFYCDDNSRAILGTMMATALLHNNSAGLDSSVFVPNIVRAILGNFRLVSKAGFCPSRTNMDDLNKYGWGYYWNGTYQYDDPHYESWIWCSFLFTYHTTGYIFMF